MQFRAVVVGPEDTTSRVVGLSGGLSKLSLVPYPLEMEDVSQDLLGGIGNGASIIIFSDPLCFHFARDVLRMNKPMLCISYSGDSLYRTLINCLKSRGDEKPRFSIDMIDKYTVEEVLNVIGIHDSTVIAKHYEEGLTYNRLTEFHKDLYVRGSTDLPITTSRFVYNGLVESGIMACRIIPTDVSIREVLEAADALASYMDKRAQICVGLLRINNWGADAQEHSEYERKKTGLKLAGIFTNFCKSINACMKFSSDNEYFFYTTREDVERVTGNYRYMPLLQDISEELSMSISMGLGYGYTAYEAEKNCRAALNFSDGQGGGCYLLTENREVIGPFEAGRAVGFYSKDMHTKAAELARKSKISVATLNRIFDIIISSRKDTITANEVSEKLDITLRSARRIICGLEESGIARPEAEESDGRGRPRQVYKINI
jgi:Predicted transcriptional regulator